MKTHPSRSRSARSWRRHRGASLVELLVVISLLMVTLVSVGTLLTRMLQASRESERDAHGLLVLGRLADCLTRDVHAAREVTLSQADGQSDTTVTCLLADGAAIEYRLTSDGARRIASVPEDARSVHERFSLPGCRIQCTAARDERVGELITFTIARPPARLSPHARAGEPPVVMTLSVLVGRSNFAQKDSRE